MTSTATLPAPSIQADLAQRQRDKKCLCGCKADVAGKIRFRPGHDARLVSQQVRALVVDGGYTGDIQDAIDFRALEIETYVSKPLAIKFTNAAMVTWAKVNRAAAHVDRLNARPMLLGRPVKIKVGRWTYDGRVAATTVDDRGRETPTSEVCAITYTDGRGREHTVQVDGGKYASAWSFVTTDASHMEEDK